MCTVISADYLFAMVLKHKESVRFGLLGDLRDKIEAHVSDVIVDLSRSSIFAAFEYYPEIFEKKPNGVFRAAGFSNCANSDYFDNEFASSISPDIHQQVQEVIGCFLQEHGSPSVRLV